MYISKHNIYIYIYMYMCVYIYIYIKVFLVRITPSPQFMPLDVWVDVGVDFEPK